ncbi:MAG: hypothetical protein ACLQNU_03370 [Candidatus Dormibacteria bacterium]
MKIYGPAFRKAPSAHINQCGGGISKGRGWPLLKRSAPISTVQRRGGGEAVGVAQAGQRWTLGADLTADRNREPRHATTGYVTGRTRCDLSRLV